MEFKKKKHQHPSRGKVSEKTLRTKSDAIRNLDVNQTFLDYTIGESGVITFDVSHLTKSSGISRMDKILDMKDTSNEKMDDLTKMISSYINNDVTPKCADAHLYSKKAIRPVGKAKRTQFGFPPIYKKDDFSFDITADLAQRMKKIRDNEWSYKRVWFNLYKSTKISMLLFVKLLFGVPKYKIQNLLNRGKN